MTTDRSQFEDFFTTVIEGLLGAVRTGAMRLNKAGIYDKVPIPQPPLTTAALLLIIAWS
jgi:hypothetical protein